MADRLLHYVLATAGHVDHGKSSLVKALTGVDPDRLPEEKARGITIDLGFALLELAAPEPCAARFQLGIVDVPGHEDFVKNMVSGVSAIDLALLVVAADDGWMPQTEEHLQILQFLGVTRAVVALTKVDLEPDQASVIAAVRRQLAGTAFANAPIIPTSTVSGQGIPELKQALAQLLLQTPPPRDYGKPRLAVDRAFTLRGIGSIVTGTLSGGRLQRGQSVVLQPSGHATRIRSIQSHNQEREWAEPGMRAALNLTDVVVGRKARAASDNAVTRGQWVTLAEYGKPAKTIDILLERSTRSLPVSHTSESMVLKDSAIVRVHHGTQNAFARILLAGVKHLSAGESCFAQLRLEAPLVAFLGDHLVIRDAAEQTTLAGGVVLDPSAARRAFRAVAQQTLLQRRAEFQGSVRVAIETQLAREKIARRSTLLLASNFSATDVSRALVELSKFGGLFLWENFVAEAGWWEELLAKAGTLIHEHHKGHPEQAGLSLSQLRSALSEDLPIAEGFDLLVMELQRAGFVQTSSEIHHYNHKPALPLQLQAAGANLRAALGAKPMDPPSRKDLTLSSSAQQALRFLIQSGEVVELGPEVVLLRASYSAATELIRQHLHRHGSATVSDLRQVVGASRRIVVPLLERLDREGITRRQGDARFLR